MKNKRKRLRSYSSIQIGLLTGKFFLSINLFTWGCFRKKEHKKAWKYAAEKKNVFLRTRGNKVQTHCLGSFSMHINSQWSYSPQEYQTGMKFSSLNQLPSHLLLLLMLIFSFRLYHSAKMKDSHCQRITSGSERLPGEKTQLHIISYNFFHQD